MRQSRSSGHKGRFLKQVALWTSVAVIIGMTGAFAVTCVRILRQASRDEARPAAAIIVFGAAEYSGKPSPVLRARLEHAYNLYSRGLAPYIITTGGPGWDPKYTEGGVSRDYLSSRGVPERSIIAETYSDNTLETVERAARIMRRNSFHSCIAVSDPYHLFRIKQMMESEGIEVYVSPRPQGPVRDKDRMANLVREAAGYIAWRLRVTHLR